MSGVRLYEERIATLVDEVEGLVAANDALEDQLSALRVELQKAEGVKQQLEWNRRQMREIARIARSAI